MNGSAYKIHFSADRTQIQPGECATLRWQVDGIKAVYFFPEGEPWQNHGVVGAGEQQVCPAQTTTYHLRVVKRDDSVDVHEIEIQVGTQRVAQAFTVDRTEIQPGECVTFRWHVEGVQAVYFFQEGAGWQGHGVVGVGEQQVCPSQTTTYRLRVVKRDDSVEVHKIEIRVGAQRAAQAFTVDRAEIQRGECVTFRWHVEGVQAVYFFQEGTGWQSHGVVGVGEQQVCPSQTTTYRLRVVKRDDSVEVHKIEIRVKG